MQKIIWFCLNLRLLSLSLIHILYLLVIKLIILIILWIIIIISLLTLLISKTNYYNTNRYFNEGTSISKSYTTFAHKGTPPFALRPLWLSGQYSFRRRLFRPSDLLYLVFVTIYYKLCIFVRLQNIITSSLWGDISLGYMQCSPVVIQLCK